MCLGLALALLGGCDGAEPDPMDAGGGEADAGPGDPGFVARCDYQNSFAMADECREYRGAGWNEESAQRDCLRVFPGVRGTLIAGEACTLPNEIGRCVVGDVDADGYVIVSGGDAAACGAAQNGCETFAGGTFEASAACSGCVASDEVGGAVVPEAPFCRDALPGEPPGLTDGQVCTPTIISGSTEPGRFYPDYADCDVVRSQRPYYAMPAPTNEDPSDPRLADSEYMAELAWVTEQAESSACTCCHSTSATPDGAALWDTEAGPLWIDTVSDEALAMLGGFTDSAAFGYVADPAANNGFDRSTTGLPTTDRPRLEAFVERELTRRGISMAEAAELPPFAPFFRDILEFVPQACEDGQGIDENGQLRWTGGGARYVYVLEADATPPGAPPNWDLPEGTLWALRVEPDQTAMSCGMGYGDVPEGSIQRVPEAGAPPALESGQQYFLYVQRDIVQPITRCIFTAP